MHFAYPARKSSNPLPFRPRSSKFPALRRSRMQTVFMVLLAFATMVYLLSRGLRKAGPYHEHVPLGTPSVVLVTVIDPTNWSHEYLNTIKENRERYASMHGYEVMIVNAYDYDTHGAPQSWAKVMAMRHALSKFPECKFVWYLDQDAYIMDPSKSLEEQVAGPRKLESLMIKDHPVIPPDSIIKTFAHLKGQDTHFVVSQDKEGLIHRSVIVRNGEWAKFFLETWLDPLYRSYNFQKAEGHGLEHLVQWHPTVLSKLALVPQRTLAAYSRPEKGEAFKDGDFVILFKGCTDTGPQSCEAESLRYRSKWKAAYDAK